MLGGGMWNLFRFVVVALLVSRLVVDAPLFHAALLWIAAPALLMVALFAGCTLVPGAERYYLPLMRMGTLLAAVTDAIVVLTGSYIPAAEQAGPSSDPLGPAVFVIVYGILAVDLLILAALISYRAMDDDRTDGRNGESSALEEDG